MIFCSDILAIRFVYICAYLWLYFAYIFINQITRDAPSKKKSGKLSFKTWFRFSNELMDHNNTQISEAENKPSAAAAKYLKISLKTSILDLEWRCLRKEIVSVASTFMLVDSYPWNHNAILKTTYLLYVVDKLTLLLLWEVAFNDEHVRQKQEQHLTPFLIGNLSSRALEIQKYS